VIDSIECAFVSLVTSIMPIPSEIADRTASISPHLSGPSDVLLASLATVAKNPPSAIMTPNIWTLLNFSCKKVRASNIITTVSNGPDKSPDFDAPTELTESKSKNNPNATNKELGMRNFQDLKTRRLLCFSFKAANERSILPATTELPADIKSELRPS